MTVLPPPLEVAGAPRDQGIAQGVAYRDAIQERIQAESRRRGLLAWRDLGRAGARGPVTALSRYLVQVHERMDGIALGSATRTRDLAALLATTTCAGLGSARAGELEARLSIPASLLPLLLLRTSIPDAVGHASLELALAPFPGCLAGVNEHGVGVVVLGDASPLELPLRELAQDFLLRATSAATGIDHLRLRARYTGGSGALLAADASGRAARIHLRRGECRIEDVSPAAASCAASTVQVDLVRRALRVQLGESAAAEAVLVARPAAK